MDKMCKVVILMGKPDTTAAIHKQQNMIIVPMDAPDVKIERALTVFGQSTPTITHTHSPRHTDTPALTLPRRHLHTLNPQIISSNSYTHNNATNITVVHLASGKYYISNPTSIHKQIKLLDRNEHNLVKFGFFVDLNASGDSPYSQLQSGAIKSGKGSILPKLCTIPSNTHPPTPQALEISNINTWKGVLHILLPTFIAFLLSILVSLLLHVPDGLTALYNTPATYWTGSLHSLHRCTLSGKRCACLVLCSILAPLVLKCVHSTTQVRPFGNDEGMSPPPHNHSHHLSQMMTQSNPPSQGTLGTALPVITVILLAVGSTVLITTYAERVKRCVCLVFCSILAPLVLTRWVITWMWNIAKKNKNKILSLLIVGGMITPIIGECSLLLLTYTAIFTLGLGATTLIMYIIQLSTSYMRKYRSTTLLVLFLLCLAACSSGTTVDSTPPPHDFSPFPYSTCVAHNNVPTESFSLNLHYHNNPSGWES